MDTYLYTIEEHDKLEDRIIGGYLLFTTFEKACDALEKNVREYCDNWNVEFTPPDIKEMYSYFGKQSVVLYFEDTIHCRRFVIKRMRVVE